MTLIIAADEIKKTLEGYDPAKSEEYHRTSAKIADKMFADAVKKRDEPEVILMSGGAASGKSEYVSVYLCNENAIILDGTLPTLEGARIKVERTIKCGKKVTIHAVLPKIMFVAFLVFLNRERKFDVSHFYRTHVSSRKTLLEIAKNYPQVEIKIITSEYIQVHEGGSMRFEEIRFDNRDALLEYITKEQYNEEKIRNEITRYVSYTSKDATKE